MDWLNKNIYFETSAVNYILDGLTREDAIATRALQTAKGNKWILSPVTLWEIMITGDENKRETMLFLCQHLFHNQLFKSPSEIFFSYLEGTSKSGDESILFSNSEIGKTWTAVCGNPMTRLEFNAKELKRATIYLKKVFLELDQIVNKIYLGTDFKGQNGFNIYVNTLFNSIYGANHFSKEEQKIYKINLLLILFIGGLGVDISSDIFRKFWENKGVTDGYNRCHYLISNYPKILKDGPFMYLSLFIFFQIDFKKSRGLLHDGFHSLYLNFADILLTNDSDFEIVKSMKLSPMYEKIFHINSIAFSKKKVWVDYEPYDI